MCRGAGLSDAKVDRVGHTLRQHPVGLDGVDHVERLDGQLYQVEVQPLEEIDIPHGGVYHTLCDALGVVSRFRHAAGVDPDTYWYIPLLGSQDNGGDIVGIVDIAGVEAQPVGAALDGEQGQAVVEMDVGDYGDFRQWFYPPPARSGSRAPLAGVSV
jgi:hypothetical protein